MHASEAIAGEAPARRVTFEPAAEHAAANVPIVEPGSDVREMLAGRR
jgi:hypothetical protein